MENFLYAFVRLQGTYSKSESTHYEHRKTSALIFEKAGVHVKNDHVYCV